MHVFYLIENDNDSDWQTDPATNGSTTLDSLFHNEATPNLRHSGDQLIAIALEQSRLARQQVFKNSPRSHQPVDKTDEQQVFEPQAKLA